MKSTAPIFIEEYSPTWQTLFDEEFLHLSEVLDDVVIEHIGSTSVKGLAAKPIIDIMIGVSSLENAHQYIATICSLGYLYIPEYEIEMPERRYFKKITIDDKHTHHIHLVEKDSAFWERHLYFRDRLRSDEMLRDNYAAVKYKLAEEFRDDRDGYTNAKTTFIMGIEQERLQQIRNTVSEIANTFVAGGDATGWFEEVYQKAKGNSSQIPWADNETNPYLLQWLDEHSISGTGKTVLVVGCGLGDDAEELSRRGFDVTAFDVSETAIKWASERFPESSVYYIAADLFHTPIEWQKYFDLVYECYTIQALPRNIRSNVIHQITQFVGIGSSLLVVARAWRGEGLENGPPWPLTDEELKEIEIDLQKISFEEFWETENNTRRILCLYKRV